MKNKPISLLEIPVITTTGTYTLENISLENVKSILQGKEVESYIESKNMADMITSLLGQPIEVNKSEFRQQLGQQALILKINGRVKKNEVLTIQELQERGYTFQLLTLIY